MISQRLVAFFSFFVAALLALWSADVTFCAGAKATSEGSVELPAQHLGSPVSQTEGFAPDNSSGPSSPGNTQEEPEEADNFMDDDSDSRREAERPRTTKRLYTTKGTAKVDYKRNTLTKAKLLSLFAVLVVAGLFVVFKGKLWPLPEDDESDEDDPKRAEAEDN